jgi:hypothetical protein
LDATRAQITEESGEPSSHGVSPGGNDRIWSIPGVRAAWINGGDCECLFLRDMRAMDSENILTRLKPLTAMTLHAIVAAEV